MNILEIIRTVDGGIAISVMVVIGWRLEGLFKMVFIEQAELIDKLTNGHEDE